MNLSLHQSNFFGKIMRITFSQILILLLMTGISYAKSSSAQGLLNKRVSLSIENGSMADVLKQLAKTNKIQFVYSRDIIQTEEKFSLRVTEQPLKKVLEELLKSQMINYEVIQNKIILKQAEVKETQAFATIKGRVTDETGGPLPGVSILLKGSTTAAQTSPDGTYVLNVPATSGTLVFSYIGYETIEIPINGRTTIDLQMKPAQSDLEEVVVVGYGTQKKVDVTGAVSRANLEDFRNAPVSNVASLLQGTVPGLNVSQVNRAGATPSISIRGQNTISGSSNVLIILDGVQYNGSLTSINPDDIASIDVLKDASSTAVYGAQAANGVILVTSKKGVSGKTRISFSTQFASQQPNIKVRPMEREEYIEHVRYLYYDQAFLAPGYTEPNPAFDLVSKIDPVMRDANGILPNNFDWYDEASKTGYVTDHQLSISGGAEKFNYLLSGNMTKNSGFILNDVFKRKGLRANLESKATDWLTVGLQSFVSLVNEDGVEPNIATIIQQSPLVLPYDENGDLKINPFGTNFLNPFLNYKTEDYDRHNYFFANIYANVQLPVKGLSYKLTFGNNYRLDLKNTSSIYEAGQTGQASKEYTAYYDYTLDNILTYNRNFGKHNFTGTLLYGANQRKSDYTRAYATVFPRLNLGYNSLEQGTNRFALSDAYEEALNYQMFRLNYNYDSRYLLTATLRRDGFSGFAENNKYGVFPSVSLGWDISKESFFDLNWVQNLKLRAGYGVAGNQTSRYASLARLSSGASYVYGDGGSTLFGQEVTSLPNPNLRWERTAGLNLGLDFTLLNNRLSGALEYYSTKTTDLLYSVNIPQITGFNTIASNVGQLNNHGVELSLNTKNIITADFQWNSTLNLTRNVNKIVKLLGDRDGNGREDDLPQSSLFIGQPINVVYNYQTDGIWQVGDQIPAGYSPGTYRIVDQNGDGKIDGDDRKILGAGNPAYRISLLNNFRYKQFSLSVFLNSIQGGGKQYLGANSPTLIRDDNTVRYNYLSGIDYWAPNNPDGKYSRSIVASTVSPPLYQSRSFVRLQDVSLSYKFSGKFLERLKLQDINVFVSGRNLATWTNWEGWDPETNQGLTNDGRPVLKGYAAGLNVTF